MHSNVAPADALDFDLLEASIQRQSSCYQAAPPFPHIVLDDFVRPSAARAAYDDFETIAVEWTKYLHVNERKFANTEQDAWGPGLRAILTTLQSERFTTFLSGLTGISGLLADDALDGGGLHRSGRGGYLNVHTDFTAHHRRPDWRRRVNLILYLNREWEETWGGALEFWSSDMTGCEQRIPPVGNRAVIFTTSELSYHGHPDPMTCPPDTFRQSLALYYFTQEAVHDAQPTNYRPRPGDGLRAVAIVADRELLRIYDRLKRRFRFSDGIASRWLNRLDRVRRRRH